ncbi:MAG: hypothetical protein K5930_04785 [Treponemataceae bacterium]|nr:hypothetical protein [Treponemataceae bacterium]
MINYKSLPEFEKDFKSLLKRYRTLEDDFEIFKKYTIETFYNQGVPTSAFVPIQGFCSEKYVSNKVRKFACRSLPGRGNQSGIRIIFIWQEDSRTVTFVEMYFKGDKTEEDRERLKNTLNKLE